MRCSFVPRRSETCSARVGSTLSAHPPRTSISSSSACWNIVKLHNRKMMAALTKEDTLGDHHLFGSLSRQGFNPSRDLIVQYSIQDEACIFASVAYTASHLELRGALPPALQSSKYRALTCRGLNSRLQAEGSSPSVVLVLLVCGTICIINEEPAY